ncbi:MAG TPA: tRNA (adenosine(37)-N6)-threonylcarbamoyltransferase complex ATPase subunit type 1 TsaE [Steroidobacteraceae bacterium]
MSLSFTAADAAQTRDLGARLARALAATRSDAPLLITLSGDLGAGKTTLVGGLLAALGHAGPVRSPTYTLIEPYRLAGRDLHHCDLYRLRHPDELEDLGLRELRTPGSVLLVEWPEKAEGRLGPADISITLAYVGADLRHARFDAETPAGRGVLASL